MKNIIRIMYYEDYMGLVSVCVKGVYALLVVSVA